MYLSHIKTSVFLANVNGSFICQLKGEFSYFYFSGHLIVEERHFFRGTMPAVITLMVDTKELAESTFKLFTYGPPSLFPPGFFFLKQRINSFKAAAFFSTRGNKTLIRITFVAVQVRLV